jgi:hypothetical protein
LDEDPQALQHQSSVSYPPKIREAKIMMVALAPTMMTMLTFLTITQNSLFKQSANNSATLSHKLQISLKKC